MGTRKLTRLHVPYARIAAWLPTSSEPPKLTDWLQGLSALVAVMTAAPALIIAVITYRGQQEINRAQLGLAQLENQRHQERFASRVVAWAEQDGTDEPLSLMRFQNRSVAPVRKIVFTMMVRDGGTDVFVATVSAPPCSLLTFRLERDGKPFTTDHDWIEAIFTDPVTTWYFTPERLRPADSNEALWPVTDNRAVELTDQRAPASDCSG
ncbi:hypothetical protein NIE79_004721 [Micromonospora sp. NIE79]|uniref:Uncharacterized protein n=1 Tax=Micromonospora trifolii TaxID=2911208 RepID=A0ABS9N870_9ACTN|nr:hypothetical protein [Micromonospora trifolii]MCG5446154.1 hypothetical protein [Micromonospora trifolii]